MNNEMLQNMNSDFLEYTQRISKSLRYVKMPERDRPSLPLTELMIEKINENREKNLEWLQLQEAANISLSASVTPCSVIVALIYIERMKTHNPDYFYATSPSDLFVVALLLAGKYLFDIGLTHESFNELWAAHSCKPIDVINQEEMLFLHAIDWKLYVDSKTFYATLTSVEAVISLREGTRRGFYTYGELTSLILPHIVPLIGFVCSTLTLCFVSYTLTILTATSIAIRLTSSTLTSVDRNVTIPLTNETVPISRQSESDDLSVTEMEVKDAIDSFDNITEICQPVTSQFQPLKILTDVFNWLIYSSETQHNNQSDRCSPDPAIGQNIASKTKNAPNYIHLPPDVREPSKNRNCNMCLWNLLNDLNLEQSNFTVNVDSVMW